MRSSMIAIGAMAVFAASIGVASAQTPSTSIDSLIGGAKNAAGLDWSGTFLRLCVPPAGPPAKDTWYAEPAKVADNLYFLGTKVHNAWAIVGSDGIIVIEALFDYAVEDEIVGGMKKLGLDINKVKYVVLRPEV